MGDGVSGGEVGTQCDAPEGREKILIKRKEKGYEKMNQSTLTRIRLHRRCPRYRR